MIKKTLRILLHIFLSICIYLFPYLLQYKGRTNIHTIFAVPGDVLHLISTILLVIFTYANYFFIVPAFYLQKKYLIYFSLIVLSLLTVIGIPGELDSFVSHAMNMHSGPPQDMLSRAAPQMPLGPPPALPPALPPGMAPQDSGSSIFFGKTYNILLFILSTFIAISIRQRIQYARIEKEKLNAELLFLKAQINPHFLFNTLNSIYSLAIIKSDETPRSITQLADLMRYIFRDSKDDMVDLSKELDYIKNYISLQQRRLGDTVRIKYDHPAEAGNFRIAPLILMSYIENAFKHGVNPDENSEIAISIHTEGNRLFLSVKNNKVGSVHHEDIPGIGAANTLERLKQLYPGRHHLQKDDEKKTYSVQLIITLS